MTPKLKDILWDFLLRASLIFQLGFLATVPLNFSTSLSLATYTQEATEMMTEWIGKTIFHLSEGHIFTPISDSTGMYLLFLLLSLTSCLLGIIWTRISPQIHIPKIHYLTIVLARYFLAFVLFHYGFAKLFKWQFFTPEPNTLFTPLGYLEKDILYWSTIGSSHNYNLFLGLSEILIASLLLFRKTYVFGSMLAFGILVNILAVNISYDISVKLFSSYLVLLSLLIFSRELKATIHFFIYRQQIQLPKLTIAFTNTTAKKIYLALKTTLIAALIISSLEYHFRSETFNNSEVQKPVLHGAYQVLHYHCTDTLSTFTPQPKRVFFHRGGYFILQDDSDMMQDFPITLSTRSQSIRITTENRHAAISLRYSLHADSLSLNNEQYQFILKEIPTQQLPLLQDDFNWTID